ncbi:MAG: glutathione S-transferase [Myxococcota bacterium]
MITVHHLNNSRSQRVLWLLEELGLPYELRFYQRDAKTMLAPPELKAIHPLGKSPVVTHEGRTLAETGAIVEYLVESAEGKLRPDAVDERLAWRYWLHYAEGSAMPPLLLALVVGRIPKAAPALIRPLLNAVMSRVRTGYVDPQLATHADWWEASLAKTGWFAGSAFSAADVMMSFPLETGAERIGFEGRPNCRRFVETIHARPAYQKALQRGGPYAYA